MKRWNWGPVSEGAIAGENFSEIKPLENVFENHPANKLPTHAQKMAILLPTLRNNYFHGSYRLHPEFVHLALQVREMADAVAASRKRG